MHFHMNGLAQRLVLLEAKVNFIHELLREPLISLELSRERHTGFRAITAPSYKQRNKISQLQKTQLNLLTVNFLAI